MTFRYLFPTLRLELSIIDGVILCFPLIEYQSVSTFSLSIFYPSHGTVQSIDTRK